MFRRLPSAKSQMKFSGVKLVYNTCRTRVVRQTAVKERFQMLGNAVFHFTSKYVGAITIMAVPGSIASYKNWESVEDK